MPGIWVFIKEPGNLRFLHLSINVQGLKLNFQFPTAVLRNPSQVPCQWAQGSLNSPVQVVRSVSCNDSNRHIKNFVVFELKVEERSLKQMFQRKSTCCPPNPFPLPSHTHIISCSGTFIRVNYVKHSTDFLMTCQIKHFHQPGTLQLFPICS